MQIEKLKIIVGYVIKLYPENFTFQLLRFLWYSLKFFIFLKSSLIFSISCYVSCL